MSLSIIIEINVCNKYIVFQPIHHLLQMNTSDRLQATDSRLGGAKVLLDYAECIGYQLPGVGHNCLVIF